MHLKYYVWQAKAHLYTFYINPLTLSQIIKSWMHDPTRNKGATTQQAEAIGNLCCSV